MRWHPLFLPVNVHTGFIQRESGAGQSEQTEGIQSLSCSLKAEDVRKMRKMLTNQRPEHLNYHSHLLIKARMLPVNHQHHILHLQRKAGVIASHTNQHNLCNYALKVTLEAESDVSSSDSGDVSDSSEIWASLEETSRSQTKLVTPAVYNHEHKEKTVNQASVITKQSRGERKRVSMRPLSQVYWGKMTAL